MGGHGRGRNEPGGFRANASGDSWQVLVVILPGKGDKRRDHRRGGHYDKVWRNGRSLAEMMQKIVEGEDCHQIWKAEWRGRELSVSVGMMSLSLEMMEIFEKSECRKPVLKIFISVLERFLP